ncbi:XRE family transcriptional regulator [Moraxella haemolytica]|uniref:helix-turn-helix domain-containing protein n=1 Tax=Moraxella haemolytica TaxID=2904119 RepID=UPI002542BA75|nr:XRE family transcriptional regulator [Moraxella sp. ZY171148]WII95967.1 XRE family transcriptional regulator [Moraxella sp. ZY171148]
MNTLAQRLKYARELANLSQQEVAKRANISQPTYFKIENGSTLKPRNILEIAQALKVNAHWLATGEGEMASKPSLDELRAKIAEMKSKGKSNIQQKNEVLSMTKPVPVLSWVAAGSWSEANTVTVDDAFDWLPRPMGLSEKGFALKVQGESMLPEFRPDDYIYVEPEIAAISLKNADLVVVQKLDGKSEATFKQLIIGDTSDDMYLKPLNPNWHEQKMIPLGEEWHLVGKVVGKLVEY